LSNICWSLNYPSSFSGTFIFKKCISSSCSDITFYKRSKQILSHSFLNNIYFLSCNYASIIFFSFSILSSCYCMKFIFCTFLTSSFTASFWVFIWSFLLGNYSLIVILSIKSSIMFISFICSNKAYLVGICHFLSSLKFFWLRSPQRSKPVDHTLTQLSFEQVRIPLQSGYYILDKLVITSVWAFAERIKMPMRNGSTAYGNINF
jgi:hypothetical protein